MTGSPTRGLRFTRLRDFGAFQDDIATLDTQQVPAMERQDTQKEPIANIILLPRQDEVSKTVPSFDETSRTIAEPPPGLINPGGTIIPFPTSSSPAVYRPPVGGYKPLTERNGQKTPGNKWLSLVIRVGFTIALFIFLLKSISWPSLLAALAHVHHPILFIGLSIGGLGVVVSSYQWRSLLRSEMIRFDLADLINLYLVGTAFSHFLPTGMGGDAIKAIYVGRESGKSDGAASSVIMSRITGFFGMLVIAAIVLIVQFQHFSSTIIIWFLLLSLAVGGMIGGAVFSVTLLPRLIKGKWSQHKIFTSVSRIGNALTAAIRRPRSLCIATLFGIVFWVIACLNYYTYAIALGIHVHLYFYFVAIPVVSLITFLPVSINGFGVRESAFVYLFSTVHVASATSLLLALLMDVQVLFFGLIGGALYLTLDRKKKGARTQHAA